MILGISTAMYSDRYQKDRRGQLDKDFGAQYIKRNFNKARIYRMLERLKRRVCVVKDSQR
jgi:hypothetical protein